MSDTREREMMEPDGDKSDGFPGEACLVEGGDCAGEIPPGFIEAVKAIDDATGFDEFGPDIPLPLTHDDVQRVSKPSNPKDSLGILKAPWSVVPLPVMAEVGLGMLEGALKYGRHNYRAVGVRASVYVDATLRHLSDFWEGEDTDHESAAKLSHISKAITSLTVLRDSMIQGNWVDDRPPPSPKGWLTAINDKVKLLLAQFPEPVAPYYRDGKRGPGRIL